MEENQGKAKILAGKTLADWQSKFSTAKVLCLYIQ